ncbi:GtrA family protein [Rickettsiella endosymbiont of Aleochara curtula]|uniref:GtrA family protein n=1 Tax=Rickettsiella endosymbiont of Aleochara curtula TaxID=3077936 RepID=UPI00313E3806
MKESLQTRKQFMRFILVGGLNTAFGYFIYSFVVFMGCSFYIATLVSTCIGIFFNFFTTGRIVFKNNNFNLFIKFIIIAILLYYIRVEFIKIILNFYAKSIYFSGFLAIFPVSIITFFLNKYVVFK